MTTDDEPIERSLVLRTHSQFADMPLRQSAGLGSFTRTRIDPNGLLGELTITVSAEWFWQYQYYSLVCFERAGARYVYVPKPTGAASTQRLNRLAAYHIDEADRWIPFARQRFGSLYTPSIVPFHPRAHPEAEDVEPDADAAPWLHADLARVSYGADSNLLAAAFGLLDLLARFRGYGSDNVRLPKVLFGSEAKALIEQRAPDALEGLGSQLAGPANTPRFPPYRAAPVRHVAVIDRQERHDSQIDGWDREIAVASLSIDSHGWSYERNVVWNEQVEGNEMT